jgi:hypothetical protein
MLEVGFKVDMCICYRNSTSYLIIPCLEWEDRTNKYPKPGSRQIPNPAALPFKSTNLPNTNSYLANDSTETSRRDTAEKPSNTLVALPNSRHLPASSPTHPLPMSRSSQLLPASYPKSPLPGSSPRSFSPALHPGLSQTARLPTRVPTSHGRVGQGIINRLIIENDTPSQTAWRTRQEETSQ